MNPNNEVGTEERKLLNLLQKMTGSEKEGELTLNEPLKNNIVTLHRTGLPDEEKLEIINRILVLMESDRICSDFLTVVFGGIDFSNIEEIEKRIDKFLCLCLLEYADFKEGFEVFRKEGDKLKIAWNRYFSLRLKEKKVPLSLIKIPDGQLYHLGYLAYNQYPSVEKAREKLREIFKEAGEKGLYAREDVEDIAIKRGENIYKLWSDAASSRNERVISPK
jgi:hypothetical protein